MKLKKFAAIDIGSNAIRILIANIIKTEHDVVFQKNSLIRSPVRLGEDSFTLGEISPKSLKRFVNTMKAFKLLMKIHEVSHYKAYATSALREANNSSYVIKTVKKKAGIKVEIIDGTTITYDTTKTATLIRWDQANRLLYVKLGDNQFPITTSSTINSHAVDDDDLVNEYQTVATHIFDATSGSIVNTTDNTIT